MKNSQTMVTASSIPTTTTPTGATRCTILVVLLLISTLSNVSSFPIQSFHHHMVPQRRVSLAFSTTSTPTTKSSRTIAYMSNNERDDNDEKNEHKKNPQPKITNRSTFLQQLASGTTAFLLLPPLHHEEEVACAFDGGVGGLGKTKPETGVVFANPELQADPSSSNIFSSYKGGGDVNAELLTPDGNTKAFLSFYAPWPMMRSNNGMESRDLSNPEAAFVQVASIPSNIVISSNGEKKLPSSFFQSTVFGQTGKFGAYGIPTDIKVKKLPTTNNNTEIYSATFTTLTPSMIESERKVLISTSIVGNGVFMLVTGTTNARFGKQAEILKKVAESFECVEAPSTSLRR